MNNIEKLIKELEDERAKVYEDAQFLLDWQTPSQLMLGKMMAYDRCIAKLKLLLINSK